MEKLEMRTPDLADENYKKLVELFPNAVTEAVNEKGEVVRAIDADVLRQEISATVVEGRQERYQFTWPDKKKSVILANQSSSKTLRLAREKSVGRDGTTGSIDTGNIYIEGDNLDALKILRQIYLGKVKMIYIDPPYNTGSDFIYKDDYSKTSSEHLSETGQYDDTNNRLVQNIESEGRFHTNWLNILYPRLRIAKDLLTNDGVIFISIDDNEQKNLEKICDEIFGPHNFVGCLVLQTATDNNPRQINTEHEYILCYAKNKAIQQPWFAKSEKAQLIQNKYLELKEQYKDDIDSIQKNLRDWIKKSGSLLQGVSHYDNVDAKGVFHDGDIANTVFGGYKYEVIHPLTQKPCKIPEKGFRFAESTMREMISNNDIMFGPDETTLIKPKKRLEKAKDILRSIIYEDGRASTKQFEALMARDIFQNPKSPTVLLRLINFVVDENDIVMDFFSGSGTTAEAVLRYNNQNNKRVRFIMVQIPENLDETITKASTRAKTTIRNAIKFLDEIGKTHTICSIGEDRIRRAGMKIKGESPLTSDNLDIGFRVFRVDSSNMEDVYYGFSPAEYKQDQLELFVDIVKPGRTSEDLLIQAMLEVGCELSSDIKETEIAGKKVFFVSENYLIACFDSNVTDKVVKEIAQRKPQFAFFRDSGFASDSVAANFEQIFETYSPKTERRVLECRK